MSFPNVTESLRDLIYFVTTAKTQSITAAAEELGMSKSAVGKSISRLEVQLGTALFNRNTRRINLTTEGEMYLQSCINALDILSAAESELLSKSKEPSGVVRIDMPAAFGRAIVMPVLLDIGVRYPKLRFTLTFNDKVIDPMREGVDLAFRFGAMVDSGDLIARPLNPQQLVLCAAPSYLAGQGAPQSISDLAGHRCIAAWRAGKPLTWLLKNEEGQELRFSPEAFHQISDGDAMVSACIAGAGIIQFPLSLVRKQIEQGELVELLTDARPNPTQLHILWPRKQHLMPGTRCIIDEFLQLAQAQAFC